MQFQIKRYSSKCKTVWNDFLKVVKNATFLFHRDFIEYHKEKFDDFSLLFFKEDKLKAVLPANLKDNILYSHQGLSYGGLVLEKSLKLQETLQIFEKLSLFCKEQNIKSIYYKSLPQIYQQDFSFEEQLFFQKTQAPLLKIDYNAVVDLRKPLDWQKRRIRALKKAKKVNIKIRKYHQFQDFWEKVLIPRLKKKYNLNPVHSLSQINYLATLFPENIFQYDAFLSNEILAGITIFISFPVIHFQYSVANEKGLELGALDFLVNHIIQEYKGKFYYLSLGISNENQELNKGLWEWKEGFGAVFLPHFHYKIDLTLSEN